MTSPILGIDLGTTNSCAAVADAQGNVTLIPYRGGEFTVPSVFAIDPKAGELVGYEAKRQSQLNPRRTVFGAKRLMGVSASAELVRKMQQSVAYKIERGPDDECIVDLEGRRLSIPAISGKILAKIREVASQHLGQPVSRAVVTVPAYFNDRQRQAVHEAGKLAQLDIVRIINEPTAAAIAFGGRQPVSETVAVYDLGGGTFDISVIDIHDGVFEVKATGGDVFLGGLDFDDALVNYVLADFRAQHNVDLTSDPIAMQRIRDMAERVKIDLSSRNEVAMAIPFITMSDTGRPIDLSMVVRRDDVEMLTAPLLERTFETCQRVLEDAGLTAADIGEVLLVGGQTRMPLVQRRIADFFGKPPSKQVHPDEAVAIGAALYAWSLSEASALSLRLLDVLPMAIGIESAERKLHRLFERNSTVPARKSFTFTTHKDDQKDLVMRLFQGDAELPHDNVFLGAFTFHPLRLGPAGSVRVEVAFDVTAEGILRLSATDRDTGTAMNQTVKLGG